MEVKENYCREYQFENKCCETDYVKPSGFSLHHLWNIPLKWERVSFRRKEAGFLPDMPFRQAYLKQSDFIVILSDIRIDLLEETISVPSNLRNIANAIEQSKYILELEKGWDEENAMRIDSNLWTKAVKFLCSYAQYISNNFERVLETPEINPCKDGSIDLSWRTTSSRMLINIRQTGKDTLAYYYSDLYNNIQPNKGWVKLEPIDPSLSIWMKNVSK